MPSLQTIYKICLYLKNFFINRDTDIHTGEFSIEDGEIGGVDFLQNGQYFRIIGSTFNDGVWVYPCYGLHDETFDGAVWAMRPPPAYIALCSEIQEWNDKYSAKVNTPFQSESLVGVYSYTKAAANGTDDNGVITWKTQFASRLNEWRKLSAL